MENNNNMVEPQDRIGVRIMRNKFMDTLKGEGFTKVEFILKKDLYEADIKKEQNRLQLSVKVVESSPIAEVAKKLKKRKEEMAIRVVDTQRRWFDMILTYIESNDSFRLRGSGWRQFVKDNNLQVGQKIEIWAFYEQNNGEEKKLCFALFHYWKDEEPATNEQIEVGNIMLTLHKYANR